MIILSISESFTILQDSSAAAAPQSNSTNIKDDIKSMDFLLYEIPPMELRLVILKIGQ